MRYPGRLATDHGIMTFIRTAFTSPPSWGRTVTVDDSQDNELSLLMRHEFIVGGTPRSSMFLTGDSVGYLINAAGVGAAPIAIYKIQHHGSLRNLQITATNSAISSIVADEAQLRAVLFYGQAPTGLATRRDYIPFDIQGGISDANMLTLYLAFTQYITTLPPGSPNAAATLTELLAREATYMTLCHNAATISIEAPAVGKATYSTYWKKFLKWVRKRSPMQVYSILFAAMFDPHGHTSNGKARYVPFGWWTMYTIRDFWTDRYLSILITIKIRAFFNSFTALAYVVSANFTYSHPGTETIVGLALALNDKNQAAPLFVTSANSVDLYAIENICTALGTTPCCCLRAYRSYNNSIPRDELLHDA